MKTKKILALLLALAMIFAMVACSSNKDTASDGKTDAAETETNTDANTETSDESGEADTETNTDTEPADGEVAYHDVYKQASTLYNPDGGNKIGITVIDNTIPHCQAFIEGAKNVIEANGDIPVVLDPGFDALVQASNIDDFVAQGCVGIVCETIDGEALISVTQAACDAGVMVASSDFNFGAGHEGLVCSQVMTPNEEAGAALAEKMAEDLGKKEGAKIVILATANAGSQARADGFRSVCEKYGFDIVFDGDGGGEVELANSVMNDQLQANPVIDAVICSNDEQAIGAYTAAETAGRADEVKCYGFDAAPEACDYIEAGRETASLGQQPYEMAKQSALDLYKALRGEAIGSYYKYTPYCIVTAENTAERLDTYYSGVADYKFE